MNITVPKFLNTDSYKIAHSLQYPEAQKMVAYGEFRKPYPNVQDNRIVFYGIDYILNKYLNKKWTMEELEEAEKLYGHHNAGCTPYPFPKDLFEAFIKENNGYFPVKIEAMPDGSVVYPHVPVYQITAEGKYSRLITFLETMLSHVWYTSNVATLSRHIKSLVENAFDKTVDDDSRWLLMSRLHDFGYRGCSSDEQAMIGGSAHLLNFDGTDTLSAAWYAHQLNQGKPFATSIPATEHSVMTSWPTELAAVENMIELFGHSVFACVADSYDYDNFLDNILPQVADKVKAKGGLMVVRPDSGNPIECVLKALYAGEKHFGAVVNKKGYKVIQNMAVIQGDGIDISIIKNILEATEKTGFSAQCVAFGCGAGLLHKHNRDTMSFATKLSFIRYKDGTEKQVMKMPKTDMMKASMPGEIQIVEENNAPKVYPKEVWMAGPTMMRVMYDHQPVVDQQQSFQEIRDRISQQWSRRSPTHNSVISLEMKEKIQKAIATKR